LPVIGTGAASVIQNNPYVIRFFPARVKRGTQKAPAQNAKSPGRGTGAIPPSVASYCRSQFLCDPQSERYIFEAE
jgi:hypothetical protein